MLSKILVAIAAIALTATAFASPADAARRYRHHGHYAYSGSAQGYSLDGRFTGQPRTCGFNTYVYDDRGVPRGPYCH
jgi:hypothetical protein